MFTIHFGGIFPYFWFNTHIRWNFLFVETSVGLQVFLGELEDAVCTSSAIEEMDEHEEDDDDEDEICVFFLKNKHGDVSSGEQRIAKVCVCVYVDKIVVIYNGKDGKVYN